MLFNLILFVYCFGAACCLFVNVKLKKDGYSGIPWIKCFDPRKYFSFVIGNVIPWIIPQHVFEQFVLRVYDPFCRANCIVGNGGFCVGCGCATYQKMLSPIEECAKGYWPKIIWNKEEYLELRKNDPVSILVKHLNEGEDETI